MATNKQKHAVVIKILNLSEPFEYPGLSLLDQFAIHSIRAKKFKEVDESDWNRLVKVFNLANDRGQ